MQALIAGEIPLAFETMLALQPHVRAGKAKALAITQARRSAAMPDIPTTAEVGYPKLVADNVYALFVRSGTPEPIIAQLNREVSAVLAQAEVRDLLQAQGAEVVGGPPEALGKYVAAEMPKWAALAKAANVKVD